MVKLDQQQIPCPQCGSPVGYGECYYPNGLPRMKKIHWEFRTWCTHFCGWGSAQSCYDFDHMNSVKKKFLDQYAPHLSKIIFGDK